MHSSRCSVTRLLPLAAWARGLHVGAPRCAAAERSYQFVVCGGGPGGLAVAASLGRRFGEGKVAVIEPSDVRFYFYSTFIVSKGSHDKAHVRRCKFYVTCIYMYM